jgi:zinc protease
VRAVTPVQIRELAARYLSGAVSASVILPTPGMVQKALPPWMSKKGANTTQLRRKLLRAFGDGARTSSVKKRRTSEVVTHVFPSGDTVIIRPVDAPTVAARVAFMGGQRMESVRSAGVGSLLGALLVRGTETRTSVEIATQMDQWACAISGFSGRNSVGISGEFLRENAGSAMALMGDCLYNPVFDADELETERAIFTQMVESSLTSARAVSFALFQKTLFGTHPYGRPIYGTLKSLAEIEQKTLHGYHRKTIQREKMALAVVGGVDVDEVLALAETHFARDRLKPATEMSLSWEPKDGPIQICQEMEKEQSHLVIGFPGTVLHSRDRFTMDVMVEILGGHGGRLFHTVREQQSLAYDISAFSFDGVEPGFFAVYGATSVGKETRFVDIVLEELDRVRKVPPTDGEMERVKRFLIGSREISQQRFAARAAESSLSWLYGLGHDTSPQYIREISKVNAAKVQRLAMKILRPEAMVISAVGPGAEKLQFV